VATTGDPGIGRRMTAREIEAAVAAAGLDTLSPGVGDLLADYLQLLLRWNARLNLTAVREPSQIIRRHLIESIQCAQALPKVLTLLDFGSGAGLPGIPIAIVRRKIHITLGESQRKKAAFLRESVRTLALNVEVYDGRIEKMPEDRLFEAITLRAVDNMAEACQAAMERLVPDGWLVLFTTVRIEQPLKAVLPDIGWKHRLPIAGLDDGLLLMGQKGDVSRGTI
jgi:16S rRNA (guanine527-N7)-methyltransferase